MSVKKNRNLINEEIIKLANVYFPVTRFIRFGEPF